MCGIAGILGFDDALAVDAAVVGRMTDALRHRGPDDGGTHVRPEHRVALGHRRLSIIDLTDAGHQPMANEDGTVWITYNGEVYNHARAACRARGARPPLQVPYRHRGDPPPLRGGGRTLRSAAPRHVRLRDLRSRRRELLLVRDRLGVKPLYYCVLPKGVLFGSEVKAILEHPGCAARSRRGRVRLVPHVRVHATPADDVPRDLQARGRRIHDRDRAGGDAASHVVGPMPSAAVSDEVAAMSEREMVAEVRKRLRDSVRRRMMSDVPFGVFLSGGLDSSTNVALMAELTDVPVRTYSTAPEGHPRYDELQVRARGGPSLRHRPSRGDVSTRPRCASSSPSWSSIRTSRSPTGRPSRSTSSPSSLARPGHIVVQIGEGADELFHGYQGYVDHRRVVVPFQRWVPQPIRRTMGAAACVRDGPRRTRRASW